MSKPLIFRREVDTPDTRPAPVEGAAEPDPEEAIEEIVLRWQAGHERDRCFRTLFDRYHDAIYRLFLSRGFAAEEAEDLIQETFLKVHRALPEYRPERRFTAWVFTIADNTGRNHWRHLRAQKRGAEVRVNKDMDPEEVPSYPDPSLAQAAPPLSRVLRRERRDLIRRAVADLPPQMRRCVLLRLDHEMLYRDIAETLQISESTVKVQIFKARQRLRLSLEPDLGDQEL